VPCPTGAIRPAPGLIALPPRGRARNPQFLDAHGNTNPVDSL
jgi:hypothetical protein